MQETRQVSLRVDSLLYTVFLGGHKKFGKNDKSRRVSLLYPITEANSVTGCKFLVITKAVKQSPLWLNSSLARSSPLLSNSVPDCQYTKRPQFPACLPPFQKKPYFPIVFTFWILENHDDGISLKHVYTVIKKSPITFSVITHDPTPSGIILLSWKS